ncbi:hypothetical protein [Tsuneonella mangrovi]|uniref:hypothetical protein n=1 Tax=Tsuneonella mangrovi TaxID=1982042 RepID=UPI000BA203ED|nr:hypothetical protein [Tsuneonella mangrovi]
MEMVITSLLGPDQSKQQFAIWSALLIALTLIPLAYPTIPPLTDIPGHMARYMIQLDAGRDPVLSHWYSFTWALVPNLGVDLLVEFLGPAIGLHAAVKAIVMAIIALQVLGILLLSRIAHCRITPFAVFAIPLSYSAAFNYGFINFSLGVALATLASAAWISDWLSDRPALRWLTFAAISCAIWICHLAAWGVLCVVVGTTELSRQYKKTGFKTATLARAFAASSCLLIPQVATLAATVRSSFDASGFFLLPIKLYFLLNVLEDRWQRWDEIGAVVILILVAWSAFSKKVTCDRGLTLAAIALGACAVVLPLKLAGSNFADMRIIPSAMIFALCAFRIEDDENFKLEGVLVLFGIAFMLARLATNTASFAMWSETISKETAVIEDLPYGSELVSQIVLPCRSFVLLGKERRTHLASYALLNRHAFSNDQWSITGQQLLTIHNRDAGAFQREGSQIADSCKGPRNIERRASAIPEQISMLWVLWTVPPRRLPGWRPIRFEGSSVLYDRIAARPADQLQN